MVRSFKPKSRFLSKYITGFSVFEKDCDLNINFTTFPHIGPGLALFKNTGIKIEKEHMNIYPDDQVSCNSVVLGKYTSPVVITYNGYVDEISVNFTPLGINYFFHDDYRTLAPENFQPLAEQAWIDFAPALFSVEDTEERLKIFEDFLSAQFRNRNLDLLQQAVDLLMDRETDYRVSEVSDTTGINEKTLRRHFNRYIGCSPVLFKRIVRFRQAIEKKRTDDTMASLTRLSQEGLFYDSSHFAMEYKKFTGKNPRSFFKEVSFLGNSRYPYIFL